VGGVLLAAAWFSCVSPAVAPVAVESADNPSDDECAEACDQAAAPPPATAAGERADGRLDPPSTRRWRLLPEVLLFPFRGLFWIASYPIGSAVRFEDRHHPMGRLASWLTWDDGARSLRPAFYYSTIYVPEFGLKYTDRLTLGVDTNLSATATVGGAHYVYSALSVEPTRVHDPIGVIFDVMFDRRGDLLYNGLGNHTWSDAANGRYLMNALESRLTLRVRVQPWLGLYATLTSGLKRFGNGDRLGGDPSIDFVYDTAAIPGFTHGTSFVRGGAGFAVDLRNQLGLTATGLLVRGWFDFTHGIDGDFASYWRVHGLVGVPIDLWQRTHVLWLQAATSAAWPDVGNIPFSELPTLGGPNDLRGFRFQDFRDYSAAWFSAEYRWPVWMWIHGAVFVDYGGVFGENYRNFGARRMQPDVGIALRFISSPLFSIGAQLGYGFGEGFNFSLSGDGP
jgi:hypothetical protein